MAFLENAGKSACPVAPGIPALGMAARGRAKPGGVVSANTPGDPECRFGPAVGGGAADQVRSPRPGDEAWGGGRVGEFQPRVFCVEWAFTAGASPFPAVFRGSGRG